MPIRELTPEVLEQYYGDGTWQHRKLYQVIDEHADRRPDVVAIMDQHESLTYRELCDRSNALARWLLTQQLSEGEAVAIQSGNRNLLAIGQLACARVGATFLPLATVWRQTEMTHLLKTSEAPIVIVPRREPEGGYDHAGIIQQIRHELPHLRVVGQSGGECGDLVDIDHIMTVRGERVADNTDPDAPHYVMVTSGTTGQPHMSLWTDNNLWCFLQNYIRAVRLREDDVALGLAPAGTGATGYVFPVLAPLLVGAKSVLLEKWQPRAALELLETVQANLLTAIPTQSIMLLQDETLGQRNFDSLRVFTNSGATLPPSTAAEIELALGCIVQQVYGATDGGTPVMTTVDDPSEKRHTTVGRPLLHQEVRLVDPLGHDVAAGERGEIKWRGPTKTPGYFNEPELTEAAFSGDGWYGSGDIGLIDECGYLHIVDRVKDLIIRGGQNISPRELEDLLIRLPDVSEVAIIGLPDPVFGERTCAVVVTREGSDVSLDDLTEYLREQNVAIHKLPERLVIKDSLPRSTGGKISKRTLRDEISEADLNRSKVPRT